MWNGFTKLSKTNTCNSLETTLHAISEPRIMPKADRNASHGNRCVWPLRQNSAESLYRNFSRIILFVLFSRKNFVRILLDKQDINSSIVFVYHLNIQAWLVEIQVMF